MQSHFEQVIDEFGKSLEIEIDLPDTGPLTLSAENRFNVQIRVDDSGHFIQLVSNVAKLPPGAFSTRVFKEALIHNGSKSFNYGILGYSIKTRNLVMHGDLPLLGADGLELNSFYLNFIDVLKEWTEALERGDPGPPRISSQTSGKGPAPFGLRM